MNCKKFDCKNNAISKQYFLILEYTEEKYR